jgi:hypothetical protein
VPHLGEHRVFTVVEAAQHLAFAINGEVESTYFLKRFSNAVRASVGRAELGVEVSFSTRTRME